MLEKIIIMKYSICFVLSGYNYFLISHLCTDSIGSSTSFEIVKQIMSKIDANSLFLFKTTFDSKEVIKKCSYMSICATKDNTGWQKESLEADVINKLLDRITAIEIKPFMTTTSQ